MPDIIPRPRPMKTIGVLGGMSDKATGEYYRLINAAINARLGGWDNGEIVIVSVNFGNIQHFIRAGLWDEATAYLAEKVDRLERAGVDVIVCVSNTMHRVLEQVMADRPTPFIHIADPTGTAIRAAGLSRVGLLGTLPIMASDQIAGRYRERFGIDILVPDEAGRAAVDRVIFDELVHDVVSDESREIYRSVIAALGQRGAQGVILGCTEIYMLTGRGRLDGLPLFDTTELHVNAAVDFALRAS